MYLYVTAMRAGDTGRPDKTYVMTADDRKGLDLPAPVCLIMARAIHLTMIKEQNVDIHLKSLNE